MKVRIRLLRIDLRPLASAVIPLLALASVSYSSAPTRLPDLLPINRVIFGGDVMLSRHVGRVAREHEDPAWQFRDIAPEFSAADLAFVNLESPFNDRGRTVLEGMVFKAEPDMIQGLQLAGIDVASTANNHSRDQGTRGLGFTFDWLLNHGIAPVGSGKDGNSVHQGVVLERHGVRFGFLAYTYDQSNGNPVTEPERVGVLDVEQMKEDVRSLRQRADVVIVSMHAGIEYMPKPAKQQKDFARAAIDSGASIVVGHHPHVVQPAESYHGGWIFYSLGNLIFDQFQRVETQHGLVAQVEFRGRRLLSCKLRPVDIVSTRPRLTELNSLD